MADLELVRDLEFSPGEGYLYRRGDEFFLVYTGASKRGWDACRTNPPPGEHKFSRVMVRGPERDTLVLALEGLLDA